MGIVPLFHFVFNEKLQDRLHQKQRTLYRSKKTNQKNTMVGIKAQGTSEPFCLLLHARGALRPL